MVGNTTEYHRNPPEEAQMLLGEYRHTIDAKNRVIVPQKLREMGVPEELWSTFILTRGPEGCIFVYTPEGWERLARSIIEGSTLPSKELRRFERSFSAAANHCTCDAQGRIVLPDKLRAYAGLKRDVVWVGVIERAELWDAERWDAYEREQMPKFEETFEKMVERTRGVTPPEPTTGG
jgi:MraZ protein